MRRTSATPDPKAGVLNWLTRQHMTDEDQQLRIVRMFLATIPEGVEVTNSWKYISENWSSFVKFVYSNTEMVDCI